MRIIEATTPSVVDPAKFRAAMGAFATGVAIVTTRIEGQSYGMAVNSLTSVSLDPCLLLVCTRRGSETGAAIRARGVFAVNLLAGEQHHLVKQFCGNPGDRFKDIAPTLSACGMPLLPDCLAHVCCAIDAVHDSGDHEIVIGRVTSIAENAGEPLVFFRGAYGGYQALTPEPALRRVAC
jgi:3-hydroxy-9,10-secoandrosta-1,3,5(10)-triene-9,17-dione monooxygenase reductase component